MTKEDLTHLECIYGRLIHVHNENINYDYMHRFKKIIDKQLSIHDVVCSKLSECEKKEIEQKIKNKIIGIMNWW